MYSCKSLGIGDLLTALPLPLASTATPGGMARRAGGDRATGHWQKGMPLPCIYITYVHLHGGASQVHSLLQPPRAPEPRSGWPQEFPKHPKTLRLPPRECSHQGPYRGPKLGSHLYTGGALLPCS